MNEKQIVILGMHRSGTSMVAGVLSRLGVDMGQNLKLCKTPLNPLGYYEDKGFLNLNRQILKEAGGTWDRPPSTKEIISQYDKFAREINEIVEFRHNQKKSPFWGWKDPRTSLTIDLYLPYLSNPYLIIVHRNPNSVADSLKRRGKEEHMDIEEGLKLTRIYEDRINDFLKRHPEIKRINLEYENIVRNPEYWINVIIDFLGLQPNERMYRESINFVLPNKELSKLKKRIVTFRRIKKGLKKPLQIPRYVIKTFRDVILGNRKF